MHRLPRVGGAKPKDFRGETVAQAGKSVSKKGRSAASGKKSAKKAPRAGGAIALTGAVGFLGSNLLEHLRADNRFERVVVLDIEKPALPIRKTRFYKTDLTEPNCDARIAEIFERENVDQVVHLAFFRSPHRNKSYAHELEAIGTLHLLHACARRGIDKFVTVTSTMCYGARADNPNFLVEDWPLRADREFDHIANKVEAENLIAGFAEKHPNTKVTVLRPAMTLGPRLRTFITAFFSRSTIPTVMGYDPLMQFVHEDDVVGALRQVVEEDHPGIYNIAGDGVLPLSTMLRLAGKWSLATPSFVLYPSQSALWMSGASDLPPQFIDYLRYLCVADGERAREKLRFSPRYSTKDTWLAFTGAERLRRFL